MALKSTLWMNGSLEWFTYMDGQVVYLGKREVPAPLGEEDAWTNELGQMFKVLDGEITLVGTTDPPRRCW